MQGHDSKDCFLFPYKLRLGLAATLMAVSFSAFAQSEAITRDTVLMARDPLNAYVERANACLEPVGLLLERNTARAIADANFVIAQDPAFDAAYAVRGQAYVWSNRVGQGVAALSIALFLEPPNVAWWQWRSEVMLFLNTTALDPTSEALLLARSRIHERNADLPAP